jgi:hypothetical protein
MTLGIAINNPGNVRISSTGWQGKLTPSRDPEFETFDTPEHGLRAVARILLTYFEEYKLNTIEGIIAKWAPDSENDTDAYIDDVSDRTGFDSDQVLTPDAPTLTALVKAITFHENGSCPYADAIIEAAVTSVLPIEDPATHNID